MTDLNILQLFGILYLAMWLGMLINPTFYKKMLHDFMQSKAILFLTAIFAITVWFVLINFQNGTNTNLIVFLNIIGWISLIKWLILVIIPQMLMWWEKILTKNPKRVQTLGSMVSIAWAAMLYIGFIML